LEQNWGCFSREVFFLWVNHLEITHKGNLTRVGGFFPIKVGYSPLKKERKKRTNSKTRHQGSEAWTDYIRFQIIFIFKDE